MDYKAPQADLLFALRHGAEFERLDGMDQDMAEAVVAEAARLVEAEVAPHDPVGDAQGVTLRDGRAHVPEAFRSAYRHYCDGGWAGISTPETFGGQGLPHVMWGVISEMLSGACVSLQVMLALSQAAQRTLLLNGTEEQQNTYLPRLASGEWMGTMCLSEPGAGSDLSLVRTSATPQDDGRWRINGQKVWITGGDQTMSDGILHLVLARCPDMPPGLKGLGLFIVPVLLPDGSRNAVTCARVEHKMGLNASPTCELLFEDAVGEIVGQPGEGLARMFTMMNAERLDVAIQGVGLTSMALQRAAAYAAERKQGRTAGAKEPVSINQHGDVQRQMMEPLSLMIPARALCLRTMVDLELDHDTPMAPLMTPMLKALCTDLGCMAADRAIQIHGGNGYTREYRVEQLYRDARITPIYEGTNGIQAMTLAGRVLKADNGRAPKAFAAFVGPLADQAADLGEAFGAWERATAQLLETADPGLAAASYLRLTGLVALGATWAKLEPVLDQAPDPALYRAAHTFFRRWLLPETRHLAYQVSVACEGLDLAPLATAAQ